MSKADPPPQSLAFDLSIYNPQGEKALVLQKSREGLITLMGDPSYVEDLIHALNTIRFFRHGPDQGSPAPHN